MILGTRTNYSYDPAGNILMVWTGDSTEVTDRVPDLKYFMVSNPSPNPFNARVVFHFEIRAAQKVTVRIYDLRGHLVRHLLDEELPAGTGDVVWDGRTDQGSDLASGMYMAKLDTEYNQVVLRMMLVK